MSCHVWSGSTVADDTETRRAQHDVQEDDGKASNVQDTQRCREAVGPYSGEQKISEMEQRCRGKRHDTHGE